MRLRLAAWIAIVGLVAGGCRVDVSEVATPITGVSNVISEEVGDVEGLPSVGPIPQSSHWHAAYVVRVCNDVLDPFTSEDDPLGIHSHGDGLVHIHPFFAESGYELAKLELFANAMDFVLRDGELTLPGGGTWRDGDLCDGVPSRVFVDRWMGPTADTDVERIFTGLDAIRFEADGELYQIAFAPADSPPVVPPARLLLPEVSNLTPPPAPWVDVPEQDAATVGLWAVDGVTIAPCAPGEVAERVVYGDVRCFTMRGDAAGTEAIRAARVVAFNRQPAIELTMDRRLQEMVAQHFDRTGDPLVLAIEVDGEVVIAPRIDRPPLANRLVVSGGLTVATAQRLATLLSQ